MPLGVAVGARGPLEGQAGFVQVIRVSPALLYEGLPLVGELLRGRSRYQVMTGFTCSSWALALALRSAVRRAASPRNRFRTCSMYPV